MKKKFLVNWEMVQFGTTEIEAEDKDEAMALAEENPPEDFGDPEQFTPCYPDQETGWHVADAFEEKLDEDRQKLLDQLQSILNHADDEKPKNYDLQDIVFDLNELIKDL